MSGYDGGLQAHIGVNLIEILSMLTTKYSLVTMSIVYVPSVQFISLDSSLCPQSTVYVPRVQFMSPEYSLSLEYSLYLQIMFLSQ